MSTADDDSKGNSISHVPVDTSVVIKGVDNGENTAREDSQTPPVPDEAKEDEKDSETEVEDSPKQPDTEESSSPPSVHPEPETPENPAEDEPEPQTESKPQKSDEAQAKTRVPMINIQEKIVFCLDMSSEMEKIPFRLGDGTKFTPLSMVKRTIELFVENKHFINKKHEFSLMVLYETASWVREFTSDPKELIESLEDLSETQECTSCDLSSIISLLGDHYGTPLATKLKELSSIIRIILIYGRSNCLFQFTDPETKNFIIQYPFFFFDIVYIHEPPSSSNKCQEIFDAICDLDENNKSYIFEVTRNSTKLHNAVAKLLAHPFQRCAQKKSVYTTVFDSTEESE